MDIFNLIEPNLGKRSSWLSRKYSRWQRQRGKQYNIEFRKHSKGMLYFPVTGAGDIAISESCHCSTAKTVGFCFGVEWAGSSGFCGGVIGRTEAKKLAEFILKKCSVVKETEEEESIRISNEMQELIHKEKLLIHS